MVFKGVAKAAVVVIDGVGALYFSVIDGDFFV